MHQSVELYDSGSCWTVLSRIWVELYYIVIGQTVLQ